MKLLITAVFAAFILVLFSCNWFSTRHAENEKSLEGKWKLDSIATNSSQSDNSISYLFLALSMKDSVQTHLVFTKDSVLTYNGNQVSDRNAYALDTASKQIIIKDSLSKPLHYIFAKDSMVLNTADSITMFLSRQK